jgi:osmotically-inducible protein OsmY
MKIRMTSLGLPAALLAASLFGACSNTARGIQEDTAQNTAKAKDASAEAAAATERAAADAKVKAEAAAEATKQAAGTAVDATKTGLEKATDATKEAAHETAAATKAAANSTANAMDGATQTVEIKSALMADKSIDASGIDVDTNGTTKTVTLKGHVPNAAQKASAARIARSKAPGYTVVNDLTVG